MCSIGSPTIVYLGLVRGRPSPARTWRQPSHIDRHSEMRGVKTRSSESNIKSILNDAFSKDFRQNFLSAEQAVARRQKKKQGTKKQAQEHPIATCTAVGPAHLSAPNLSNIIGYAAMERHPTFSGDHGALTNRHRRPGRGACPSPFRNNQRGQPNLGS